MRILTGGEVSCGDWEMVLDCPSSTMIVVMIVMMLVVVVMMVNQQLLICYIPTQL